MRQSNAGHAHALIFAGAMFLIELAGACPAPSERERLRAQSTAALGDRQGLETAFDARILAERQCAPEQRAALLDEAQLAAGAVGALDLALRYALERVRVAREHGLVDHLQDALGRSSSIWLSKGQPSEARAALSEAIELATAAGLANAEADHLSDYSRLERREGNYLAALRWELRSLETRRRSNPPYRSYRSLGSLATLYEQIEMLPQAREYYAAALDAAEKQGSAGEVAGALTSFAGFLNDFGAAEAELAESMARRAQSLYPADHFDVSAGSVRLQIGRALLGQKRYQESEQSLREALRIAIETGSESLRAHVEFRLGELEFAQQRYPEALKLIHSARDLYLKQGNRHRLTKVYRTLEEVHTRTGDELAASRAGREHYRLRNELLGPGASGELGELLSNYALSEERLRNQALQLQQALTESNLVAERRTRWFLASVVVALSLGLAFAFWRHRTIRRLVDLLSESEARLRKVNQELEARSAELYELSVTDVLTGLKNRRFSMDLVHRSLAEFRASGQSPALLWLDLDHFKQINDRFGHDIGDRALQHLAEHLRQSLHDADVIGRVGGEEFVVLYRDVPRERALTRVEAAFARVRNQPLVLEHSRISVLMSAALCFPRAHPELDAASLLRLADQTLYRAKVEGRDRYLLTG